MYMTNAKNGSMKMGSTIVEINGVPRDFNLYVHYYIGIVHGCELWNI